MVHWDFPFKEGQMWYFSTQISKHFISFHATNVGFGGDARKNDVLHNVAIVSMLPHMLSGMQYYRSAKILPVAVSCLMPKRPFRIPYCLCFIICAQNSWFGFCLMDAKFSKTILVSVVCFILSTILLVYFAVCSFFFRLCFCWFALEELRPNPKNATYIGKVLN